MECSVYKTPMGKKVAQLLTRNEIINYCPLNKVHRQWSDRKKVILEPLFKSYVFVQIAPNQQLAVRQTEGVINFLYWLGRPALIKDKEIEVIKRFMNDHDNVQLRKISVSLHDKVRITNGPLMMREGNVLEIKHKTVKILLPSLGYTLVAEIEKTNVQIINGFSAYSPDVTVDQMS